MQDKYPRSSKEKGKWKNKIMSGHQRKWGLLWWGPPAGTNGPGRLDGRGSPQIANFMAYPATESFHFSIGSVNPPKCYLNASKSPGRPTLNAGRQLAEPLCTNATSTLIRWKQQCVLKPIEELTTIGELRSPELTTIGELRWPGEMNMHDRRMEYDLSALRLSNKKNEHS